MKTDPHGFIHKIQPFRFALVILVLLSASLACNLPNLSEVTATVPASNPAPVSEESNPSEAPGDPASNAPVPAATRTPLPTGTQPAPSEEVPARPVTRPYDIVNTIELVNDGPDEASRIVIWVALIQTVEPYQQVTTFSITPENYKTVTDEYGNLYAEIEFNQVPAGETRVVEISYQVLVHKINNNLKDCSGDMPTEFLDPEMYIESDAPEIFSIASSIRNSSDNLCQAARSIYDYVGDEITYSQYTPQDVGALTTLAQKEGDCTEFSDLFIALNRAAGIPARFVEGVTCCTTNGYQAGQVKHDWSEVYLPGNGWVPVDATWGRFSNQRDLYFAAMSPDHIVVTRGRNLDMLGGYHYYYYRYFWDNEPTTISSNERWSILLGTE